MSVATAAGTFGVGVVFGLALAAPPGPMNAVIAEESVLRGWVAGFTAGLGAMTADLVFFALSLAGVVAFLQGAETVRAAMVGVGGLLMLYFAVGAARDARADFLSDDAGPDADDADARGFTKAFVLALTNPYQIIFWLTVGVGLLEPGTVDVLSYLPAVGEGLAGALVVRTGSPALLAGLFGGIVVWITGFPATLVSVGRRVDAFAPAAAVASALVLAGFGLTFCWTAARTLAGL
ncbi:LysE family L-lysine efflux protein [Halosimplex carlsbadense 2-9-1]|uniref:LysE family L-lysine efflux protein n=1 Tax=Halosimplex carlsbadense 2-9-1 TaxID=797114 RepID=M0CPA6_9EURY|nr:LysE family transporter [Halosimplex carlsbadense]ELZ25056.1 LysE family L-lysine efflux protein [Halosimplex carlsbadense 2-9-1]